MRLIVLDYMLGDCVVVDKFPTDYTNEDCEDYIDCVLGRHSSNCSYMVTRESAEFGQLMEYTDEANAPKYKCDINL